jgi:hypothetical protein
MRQEVRQVVPWFVSPASQCGACARLFGVGSFTYCTRSHSPSDGGSHDKDAGGCIQYHHDCRRRRHHQEIDSGLGPK